MNIACITTPIAILISAVLISLILLINSIKDSRQSVYLFDPRGSYIIKINKATGDACIINSRFDDELADRLGYKLCDSASPKKRTSN